MRCSEVKLSDGSRVFVRLVSGKKLSENDRLELEAFREELAKRAVIEQRKRNRRMAR